MEKIRFFVVENGEIKEKGQPQGAFGKQRFLCETFCDSIGEIQR